MVEFPFSVNVGPDKTSETCAELNKEMETVPESARLKLSFVDEIVKLKLVVKVGSIISTEKDFPLKSKAASVLKTTTISKLDAS